jgi:small-conductance mechanosensitive channel
MAAIITARFIGYLLVLVGLIYALNTLGVRVGPLLGALGLGGLVLALALQKVVENFVGALILQTRRPFTVGETVMLDDQTGIVTDIDSRTTVLRGLDGTMIRIPNGSVLASTIINLTRSPARRSQLQVGVAYDTNLDRATETLNAAVTRVRRVLKDPPPLVVLHEFGTSSIDFTIYYWHASDVPSELATTHDLMLAIHHAFADNDITIAFPQVVVWPGHEADANPYDAAPGTVYTAHAHESESNNPTESARWWARRRSE